MKKFSSFALVVCLMALGVAAVLSTRNPAMQVSVFSGIRHFFAAVAGFVQKCLEAIQFAFS